MTGSVQFGRWAILAFLAVMVGATVVYSFVQVIGNDPYFSRQGFYALSPEPTIQALSYVTALAPTLWLPRTPRAPSDICVHYLYFFTFLPSCVLFPYIATADPSGQGLQLGMFTLAFGLVEVRKFVLPLNGAQLSFNNEKVFELILWFFIVICLIILATSEQFSVDNLSLTGVYERRSEFLSNESFSRLIVGYAANWGAVALAPVALVYGLDRRRPVLAMAGLVLAVATFAATSFKSHVFVPLLIVGLYFAWKAMRPSQNYTIIGLLAWAIAILPVLLDAYLSGLPVATWTVNFRFLGNNGFLTAQYFNFFENHDKGLYADSIGRLFVEPRYNVPVAQIVGETFSPVKGNHANANLWADGFGNLGYPGIMLASIELILFLWAADILCRRLSLRLAGPVMISACFALANTSVHTMLTSNGGLPLLMLLAIMPPLDAHRAALARPARLALLR